MCFAEKLASIGPLSKLSVVFLGNHFTPVEEELVNKNERSLNVWRRSFGCEVVSARRSNWLAIGAIKRSADAALALLAADTGARCAAGVAIQPGRAWRSIIAAAIPVW
jgi:hypothetical protein